MRISKIASLVVLLSTSQFGFSSTELQFPNSSVCKGTSDFPEFKLDLDTDFYAAKITTADKTYIGSFDAKLNTENTRLKGYTFLDITTTGERVKIELHLTANVNTAFGYGIVEIDGMKKTIFLSCTAPKEKDL